MGFVKNALLLDKMQKLKRYFSFKHTNTVSSPSPSRKGIVSAQGRLVAASNDTVCQGYIPASILALGIELPKTAPFGYSRGNARTKSVKTTSVMGTEKAERETRVGDVGGVRKTKTALEVAAESAATDDTVRLAIEFHENGQLEKSLEYLRIAADRGAPSGLFLLGMALRHGWGCKVDPKQAFQYLLRAAETAAAQLNELLAQSSVKRNGDPGNDRTETNETKVAKAELVLSVYELGISFLKGWGVKKDKTTAAYYLEIAANLGDPDAQNDIAARYYNGQGVKKDVFKAAKYFRMAAAQGHEIVGNSWIYKEKYGGVVSNSHS